MRHIETNGYTIEIGSLLESSLHQLLRENYSTSKKIILVDENTHKYCLSHLITNFEELNDAEVIQIPAGEHSKQMTLAVNIWEAFTEYGISRHDLIINLGGGVVSDLGGFVASCFKRGLNFINIPTSLLSMVDASIGGKTGINLGHYKNQIGVFSNPIGLFIDPVFLDTLPEDEIINGYAEMLKHGVISSVELYNRVQNSIEDGGLDHELLQSVIEVKNDIIKEDPLEKGKRKILNFGHTVGHVIEGCLIEGESISHGHAVGIGMVMEAYLSKKIIGLSSEKYEILESFLLDLYPIPKLSDEDIKEMITLLNNDKKNKEGSILCCLISKIGECTFDNKVSPEDFLETFLHFKNKQVSLN